MRSLLGRDVLDTWRMDYDPCHNRLLFEVLKAHRTIQLSPGELGNWSQAPVRPSD